jgi:predicted nucleotidyltransferase
MNDYFQKLLSAIEPSVTRVRDAQRAYGLVRDHLKQCDVVPTVDPHTRLAGSYARETAINDIKDVDILVRLSGEQRDLSPADVLMKLAQALRLLDDVTDVELTKQRRSVHATMVKHDVELDIVPVVAANGMGKRLEVPDKPQQEWVDSNPLGYADMLTDLNQKHGCKVVPLIKLGKQWRDTNMRQRTSRPKSFWLECMTYEVIDNGTVTTAEKGWGELFRDLLVGIRDRCLSAYEEGGAVPRIKDPSTDKIVTTKWERAHFETFMGRLEDAIGWADRALAEEDVVKQVALWRRIFGDRFPEAEQAAAAMSGAIAAGQTWVTSEGRVLRDPPGDIGRSVKPPATRFYGGRRRRLPRFRSPELPPARYYPDMSRHFPGFAHRNVHGASSVWIGALQPSADSPRYAIEVRVPRREVPRVRVKAPVLLRGAPHTYRDGSLCLYDSEDGTWSSRRPLSELVALAAEWLWFYELWLLTGKWLGPESPHGSPVSPGGPGASAR